MDPIDISRTLAAKSDQLNADDLMGGPVTVTITDVSVVAAEQPVIIKITDGYQPWKPCKTMRRLMAEAWGANAAAWIGRRLTLYRDPAVTFGDGAVGGIRISHMSHIKSGFTVNLTARRGGKKGAWHVAKLPDIVAPNVVSDADLKAWATDAIKARGWTRDHVVELFAGPLANVPAEKRPAIVAKLKGAPPSLDFDSGEPTEAQKAAIHAAEAREAGEVRGK